MEKFRLNTETRKVTKSTFVEVVKFLSGNPGLRLKRTPKDTVEYLNSKVEFLRSKVPVASRYRYHAILDGKIWALNELSGDNLVFDLYSFFSTHPSVVTLNKDVDF